MSHITFRTDQGQLFKRRAYLGISGEVTLFTVEIPNTTCNLPKSTQRRRKAMDGIPRIREANQALLEALESHSAFQSQSQARSGKVYFMWDFAKRNEAMFNALVADVPPPDTPATRGSIPNAAPSSMTDQQKNGLVQDAVGRCMVCFSRSKCYHDC